MNTPLTGTVITFNEEDHIEACIASLRLVCDEVIVVDSLSTDRTTERAKAAGAVVIDQEYLGEGKQRNVTEAHASHDWILALDADERCDDEMVNAIRGLRLESPDIGYAFNRKSYVGSHWLRGPGFYPDIITRLYNKNRSAYESKFGHAGVIAPEVQKLPGHILHYTYDDITDWIAKINQVTSLDARGMFEAGRKPSVTKPVFSAVSSGFRELVLRGGLFRGGDAWTIALTSVFRSYIKYLKLNELYEREARPGSDPGSGSDPGPD